MMEEKKKYAKEKSQLHPRNKHRERYDFKVLTELCPELSEYVTLNIYKDESIDFSDPKAVKTLNKALLKQHYGVNSWDIPEGYLTPPIPGRADYIHYMADLLRNKNYGTIPESQEVRCLDIGVGANCVYPIIACSEYGWSVVGTDIDVAAIEAAQKIISENEHLADKVELRVQNTAKDVFFGIVNQEEQFDLAICNPPFHASEEDARKSALRKVRNLKQKNIKEPVLNFGGNSNELWCIGGEKKFISNMIRESKLFAKSCFWYSTLVSKQSNLKSVQFALQEAGAVEVETIPMGQGNKSTRVVAWTFLTLTEQKEWRNSRWIKK